MKPLAKQLPISDMIADLKQAHEQFPPSTDPTLLKALLFQPTLQFLQTYVEDQNRTQQTKIKLKEQQVQLNAEESTELRD
jgi:hypothetical protein